MATFLHSSQRHDDVLWTYGTYRQSAGALVFYGRFAKYSGRYKIQAILLKRYRFIRVKCSSHDDFTIDISKMVLTYTYRNVLQLQLMIVNLDWKEFFSRNTLRKLYVLISRMNMIYSIKNKEWVMKYFSEDTFA